MVPALPEEVREPVEEQEWDAEAVEEDAWGATGRVQAPVETASAPTVERKYLTNKACRVTTKSALSADQK